MSAFPHRSLGDRLFYPNALSNLIDHLVHLRARLARLLARLGGVRPYKAHPSKSNYSAYDYRYVFFHTVLSSLRNMLFPAIKIFYILLKISKRCVIIYQPTDFGGI